MNRMEFMAELERLLADMPEDERQAAVQYYADYFADAGEENEQDVIRELGSPEKVAESIKADYYGTEFNEAITNIRIIWRNTDSDLPAGQTAPGRIPRRAPDRVDQEVKTAQEKM